MSGSSNSYSGSDSGAKDCNSLIIKTHLASPNRSVIDEIDLGDMLSIELTPPTGPLSVITADGKVAGSILHMDIDSLIQCIADGHEYQAKVIEINMGNCQVLIKHK